MLSLGFILLSFISALGDAVFLTGIPLYFFKTHNNSIYATSFIQIAITLTILFSRKLIISTNKKNPLLVTGFGELAMAAVEVLLLLMNLVHESTWLNVIGVIPLAMIYNTYAPAKFLKLQDYFFPEHSSFHYTALQSGSKRFGTLTGIVISGWVVESHGIPGILLVDIASFALFGGTMLYFYSSGRSVLNSHVSSVNAPTPPTIPPVISIQAAMIFISLVSLFVSWERASSISVAAKTAADSIANVSVERGLAGALGILVGILISKYRSKSSVPVWVSCALLLTVGMVVFGYFPESRLLLFFGGGVLSTLEVAIQRLYYKIYQEREGSDSQIFSRHFVFNAVLTLSLLPIGYLTDLGLGLTPLQIAGLSIAIVGLTGGTIIYRLLQRATP